MKAHGAPIYYLIIIIFGLTACNLGKPPAVQPPTQTGSSPSSLPVTAAGPVSLAQLYEARLKSGEWTEAQGLASLLGVFTGTADVDSVLGNARVSDFEITGLMRLAVDYLASNPSGSGHDQVQHQVNLLKAPVDRLDPFSHQASLLDDPAKSARESRHSLTSLPLGDEAQCQGLWADGFTSTTPVMCFQYADLTADGTPLRLYYPDWWPATDSRVGRMESILEAARQAVHSFNVFGPSPIPPVTMVVTELAGRDSGTHRPNADILAMAVPEGPDPLRCYVGIFPSLFTKTVEQAQQALAHEMFHCYQYQNLTAQEHEPIRSATEWWVEGSAEYFSNVVYPSVNFEHRWLTQLPEAMLEDNLFAWSYKSFIFFQYLENRADTRTVGILRLLQALPTASGSGLAQQMAAMSAYPNMAAIFQGFGEAVADQKVMDSNGSALALQIPFYPDDIVEPTAGDIIGRGPFAVDIHRVIFPQDFNYDVTAAVSTGSGQVSAHPEAGPLVWGSVPAHVNAGCIENHYIVVATQTSASPDASFEMMLRAASTPATGTCSCLTGRWNLDNGSYLTHLNGLIEQAAPGTVHYMDVSGQDVVEFSPDGRIAQSIDNLTVNAEMNVTGMPTQTLVILMNGTTEAGFQELNGALTYDGLQSHLTIGMDMNGQPLVGAAPGDYLAAGPLGTGATYVCSGDTLTLIPVYPNYHDLPPLSLHREP